MILTLCIKACCTLPKYVGKVRITYSRRFYDLREEVIYFLKMKWQPVHEMENKSWLFDLAFLVDITTYLNDFNTVLQKNGQ